MNDRNNFRLMHLQYKLIIPSANLIILLLCYVHKPRLPFIQLYLRYISETLISNQIFIDEKHLLIIVGLFILLFKNKRAGQRYNATQ